MQASYQYRLSMRAAWALALLLIVGVAATTASRWLPVVTKLVARAVPASRGEPHHDHEGEAADAGHDEHDHEAVAGGHDAHETAAADDHDAETAKGHDHKQMAYDHVHDESGAVVLSTAARKNIGLKLTKVELKPFERTMTVPAVIVERPGWSVLEVTSPMTGVVARIYPIQGEAVEPGQRLFDVRLTHEDLLQVQTEFLRTVEELDVINREVARLEKVAADGVIAGKTLLERKYEQQKQQAALRAQRQALLLHGLSQEQVDGIVSTRTLLQSLTICAPRRETTGRSAAKPAPDQFGDGSRLLQVQQLKVSQGKHVAAGETLCTLMDCNQLYIEGMAFEQDLPAINRAAAEGYKVAAILGSKSGGNEETVSGLRILYLDDKVERESRALHFYVTLPNSVLREEKHDGRRFVYWQFRPGQRVQLRVPVERWTDRIVLPVESVAQDGAEHYVFEENQGHFDRRPVHVEYRDQFSAVIANDGALTPGKSVIVSGAYQVHLAIKNKAGGAPDPHAGHNH